MSDCHWTLNMMNAKAYMWVDSASTPVSVNTTDVMLQLCS
jgi:hypothetical protein